MKQPSKVTRWRHNHPSLFKGLKWLVIGLVAAALIIILYVAIVVTDFYLSHKHGTHRLQVAYAAAQTRCGHQPYFVYYDDGFIEPNDASYTIYGPASDSYDRLKTSYDGFLTNDKPVGYYCTEQAAQSAYPHAAVDNGPNDQKPAP